MRIPKNFPAQVVSAHGRRPKVHVVYCDDQCPERGKTNPYICQQCRKITYTRHIDEGVTPFMIICLWCGGMATSCMYPSGIDSYHPIHAVWKKEPNSWWGDKEQQRHHASNGGVFLYYLKGAFEVPA